MVRELTKATALAAYTICVEECGARPLDETSEYDFLHYATRDDPQEWRFQGSLGFGGKPYFDGPERLWVGFYAENRTPERDEAMSRANERLRDLCDGRHALAEGGPDR